MVHLRTFDASRLTPDEGFMPKNSAGLLMYRRRGETPEVFLIHPGGPYWRNKDQGAWTIPKGEYSPQEDPLTAAQREFTEETGCTPGDGHEGDHEFSPLTPVKQSGGKVVRAWAFEGECDPTTIKSNTFEMEWPPGSGKREIFPEADKAAWFDLEEAKRRILPAQQPLIEELKEIITKTGPTPACDATKHR